MNIILLDDDVDIIELLSERLMSSGHKVVTFLEASDCIDYITKDYFDSVDWIITDYNMPKMDGYSFSKAVKEFKPYQKIILHTSEIDIPDTKYFDFVVEKYSKEIEEIIEGENNVESAVR